MQCGLYGKLPAKRDFIAIAAPREFLNAWEPWMQGGISASRVRLGEDWQNAFVTAPIWRFWLGADICGTTVIGAFMSSLDGVGRYFPLTLFACADPGSAIAPPELDPQDDWFALIEEFLMSTLEDNVQFERVTASLDQLGPPTHELRTSGPDAATRLENGTLALGAQGRGFRDLFGEIRTTGFPEIYAASTFWWTIGGEGYDAVALGGRNMPTPFVFAGMLTGQFARQPE